MTDHMTPHLVEGVLWWGVVFSGAVLGRLLSVKGNLNASTNHDIVDNSMVPTLWEQLGAVSSSYQHDCAPQHKGRPKET